MTFVRIVTERFFLVVYSLVRATFFAMGLAICAALAAVWVSALGDSPDWLKAGLRSIVLIGAIFLLSAGSMVAARGLTAPPAAGNFEPGWPWPALLALSLVACPLLLQSGMSGLVSTWSEIAGVLDDIGFWHGISRPDPVGGVVLLPIFVVLLVPLLETVTAIFLAFAPVGLLVLLFTRSRLFPTIFAMTAACTAGLAAAGLLAADAISRLVGEATVLMETAGDLEVQQVADLLGRLDAMLTSVAWSFVLPVFVCLAWLPFLIRSPRVGAFFTEPPSPAGP